MKKTANILICIVLIPIIFIGIFNFGELFTPDITVTLSVYVTNPDQISLTYQKDGKYASVSPVSVDSNVNENYTFTFKVPKSNSGVYTINFGADNKSARTAGISLSTAFRVRSIGASEMQVYFTKGENITNIGVNTATGLISIDSENGNASITNEEPITKMATPINKIIIPLIIAVIAAVILSLFITAFVADKLHLKAKPKKTHVDGEAIINYEDGEKKEEAKRNPIPSYVALGIAGVFLIGIFFGGFPPLVLDSSSLVKKAVVEETNPDQVNETLSLKEQIAQAQKEKEEAAQAEKEALGIQDAVDNGYDDTVVYPMMTDSGADYESYNTPKVSETELRTDGFTSQNVYVGKTDDRGITWYFYGDELDEYNGMNLRSDKDLAKLAKTFSDYADDLAAQGIEFYILVGPNKSTIYPENTPSKNWYGSSYTLMDQIFDYLKDNTKLNVIDVREDLKAAKDKWSFPLYYEYDTHWNNYGGFTAYTKMMQVISEKFPLARTRTEADYQINMFGSYMKDQLWYLGYYNKFDEMGPVFTPLEISGTYLVDINVNALTGIFAHEYEYPDGFHDWNAYSKFVNPELQEAGAPSVYVIRDSFAISLTYFIRESFSSSVFNMTHGGLASLSEIKRANPDIVIYEVAERSLGSMFTQ